MGAYEDGPTPEDVGTMRDLRDLANAMQAIVTHTDALRVLAEQLTEPKPVTVRGSERIATRGMEVPNTGLAVVQLDAYNLSRLRVTLVPTAAGLIVTTSQPAIDGLAIPTTGLTIATRAELWVRNVTGGAGAAIGLTTLFEYED